MNREKQRNREEQAILKNVTPIVKPISDALMKYMRVASKRGPECYVLAKLGQILLAERGVSTQIQVGGAAWRLGPYRQDWVAYAPLRGDFVGDRPPEETSGFPYHAWLDHCDCKIDLSIYDLREEAALLQKMDGLSTTVTWCPNFLILPRTQIRSLKEVIHSSLPGTAYYERRPEFEPLLHAGFTLDREDLSFVRLLLANPNAVVGGHHGFIDPRKSEG